MRVTSFAKGLWQRQTVAAHAAADAIRSLAARHRFQYAALALAIVAGSAYAADVSGLNVNDNAGQALNTAKASLTTPSGSSSDNANTAGQPSTSQDTSTRTNVHVSAGGTLHTNVTVNGDDVAVPSNGVTHKTIMGDNGNTSIDISNTSSVTGSNSSNTTLNVSVESETTRGFNNE